MKYFIIFEIIFFFYYHRRVLIYSVCWQCDVWKLKSSRERTLRRCGGRSKRTERENPKRLTPPSRLKQTFVKTHEIPMGCARWCVRLVLSACAAFSKVFKDDECWWVFSIPSLTIWAQFDNETTCKHFDSDRSAPALKTDFPRFRKALNSSGARRFLSSLELKFWSKNSASMSKKFKLWVAIDRSALWKEALRFLQVSLPASYRTHKRRWELKRATQQRRSTTSCDWNFWTSHKSFSFFERSHSKRSHRERFQISIHTFTRRSWGKN